MAIKGMPVLELGPSDSGVIFFKICLDFRMPNLSCSLRNFYRNHNFAPKTILDPLVKARHDPADAIPDAVGVG